MFRQRVLVVDDSKPIRLLLRSYLEKCGVREGDISMAEDGASSLTEFDSSPPDIVFLDVEMPRMGGGEAAAEMLSRNPMLKIVVMTGVERSDDRVRELRSHGVFDVIEKPVRLESVRNALKLIREEQIGIERIR